MFQNQIIMKLCKRTSILFILITFSFSGFAQKAEDIIAKHIKAHGGEKNWNTIKSMELKGLFTAFSEEHPFYALRTHKGEYYSDLNIGQHEVKEAFNGEWGWTIDPWHDFTYPRKLNTAERNVFIQKADFFTPFYNYKEKGYEVEYIGEKSVDGIDTYVLKLKKTNGSEETWYLDKKTYLEYKYESNWADFAMAVPCETYFDDFKEVDGFVIPFYIERMFGQRNRMLELETVTFNVDYDISFFEMPRSEEMKKFEPFVGKWKVSVERMNRRGEMQVIGETISKCKFKELNLLQMKITVDDYYVMPMTILISWHNESEQYRVIIYSDFSSSAGVYLGEFNDKMFIADNNVKVNEFQPGNSLQMKLNPVSDDTFIMEINSSRDKGENWSANYKLSFSK